MYTDFAQLPNHLNDAKKLAEWSINDKWGKESLKHIDQKDKLLKDVNKVGACAQCKGGKCAGYIIMYKDPNPERINENPIIIVKKHENSTWVVVTIVILLLLCIVAYFIW